MLYAGIDWADDHHDVAVLDERGQLVATTRVAHTADGLARLGAWLRERSPDLEQLACVVETAHGLLIAALLEAGVPVYPVNPKTVDRRRPASGAKTDALDAYLLAKTARSDLADLRRLAPDSPLVRELQQLTHDQDQLIASQTRLVNQLTACLKAYYPVALALFAKLQQPSTLAFLRAYPTPAAARAATPAALAALLAAQRHPHPATAAAELHTRLHAPALEADAVTTRTKARLLLALVSQLEPLHAQIAAYDQEITRLFLTHPDQALFASLPRAGTRLAPRLLAGWGDDRARFASAASVQALAGTAPVPRASGTHATVHMRHACSKPLRNTLHQFAWQSTLQDSWAAEYYRRKRREGKSHSLAVRALANVWVRILYAMWRDRTPYDPATFQAAQARHAPRAA